VHAQKKNYDAAIDAAQKALDASKSEASPDGDPKIRKRLEKFRGMKSAGG
jgi:hypothetical protein